MECIDSTRRKRIHLLTLNLISLLIGLAVFALALVAGARPAEATGTVWYVRAGATGADNGTSWADAYTSLQAALDAAVAGDQVWVAAGTYKPTNPYDPGDLRTAIFRLKNNVAIYGGFAGTETLLSQRTWFANVTTLSGDLDNSGGITDSDAYHVIAGSGTDATAVLDGFSIIGGNANGTLSQASGGGMFVSNGSPTLSNLVVNGNVAGSGGGMYLDDGSPTLTNVVFIGNVAGGGGGLWVNFGSPTLTDVAFIGNAASIGTTKPSLTPPSAATAPSWVGASLL